MTPEAPATTALQVVVVPHTHWDREWYLPFEVFRIKLVRLIDQLLAIFAENPSYSHFMLDGQTIVLDDYLAVRPEREGELRALVESGRMAVGPWYVLPDEFLVSGESLVRNLQVGLTSARRFGRSMELGYLPDSFGHVAQMPQVFAGFGFDSGCLWRGVGDDNPGAEWHWAALDGTSLYIQWLVGGYGNLGNLPSDPEAAYERFAAEVAKIAPLATARTYLLMNGSDHLMPQAFLPGHLAAFNARHPGWDIVQGSLEGAIARARSQATGLKTVHGELRQAADTSLLPGVLSARGYLKIANAHAQTLLERWVEPFSALATLKGRPYPAGLIRQAWKTLLQNHPHDSICGCSVDAVHRQMIARFEAVEQLGTALQTEAFAVLQNEDPEAELSRQAALRLYNPHPWAHTAAIETEITLDCEVGEEPVFALLDEHEQPVPFELGELARGVRVVNRSPLYPYNVATVRASLRLVAELPALGYRTLKIERAVALEPQHPELYAGHNWIENRYFKVRAIPGGVELFDKTSEELVTHTFEDAGDRGDEYNFCPVESEGAPLGTRDLPWAEAVIHHGGNSITLALAGLWQLPAGLAGDRQARVGAAPLAIAVVVSLHAGIRRVDFETTLDNRSCDHRLRAAFQTSGAIAHTTADTAFGWVTRSSTVAPKPWAETPMGTFPMVSQVFVDRPWGTAGLATRGLHEYEAVGDTLYLTLLRSVGWLSREDLSTRQGDAGPMLAAPEAQCLGRQGFCYAWTSQDGEEPALTASRRAQEFVVPSQAFATADWTGHEEASFMWSSQPAWQFSALKQADSGQGLILRFFNATDRPQSGSIAFNFPVRRVRLARLDETPGDEVVVHDGEFTAFLRGFEIATFLIEA